MLIILFELQLILNTQNWHTHTKKLWEIVMHGICTFWTEFVLAEFIQETLDTGGSCWNPWIYRVRSLGPFRWSFLEKLTFSPVCMTNKTANSQKVKRLARDRRYTQFAVKIDCSTCSIASRNSWKNNTLIDWKGRSNRTIKFPSKLFKSKSISLFE